jgi:hypothetical protein
MGQEKRQKMKRLMLNAFCLTTLTSLLFACGADTPTGGETPTSVEQIKSTSKHIEGFFNLFQDNESGKTYLALTTDQLDREFIHHYVTVNGSVTAGHFVGQYGQEQVLSLRRHFNRIEFVAHNTHYYFNPDNALSKAASANIPQAILAVEEIVAEDKKTGEVLISLDGVLLKEKLNQIKPTPDPEAPPKETFSLGKLSESRSKILRIKNYPENTAVISEYVYENPAPIVYGGEDVTDSRSMSVQVEHTFLPMPDDGFKARRDDYRVGFISARITDLTDPGFTPYRDVINRWHLVKKDPTAELSDPVEPITWWIENTTPHEWRDLIRGAALAWNSAFEKAGFSNAIAVEIQPDDAAWDAGDIRYNVLRWTSSPVVPFGGYGPSITNPRTGQILGADVMLEFAYVRNHRRAQLLLQPDVSTVPAGPHRFCSAGMHMSENYLFASSALGIFTGDSEQQQQLLRESLYNLILHEIGHTLGLMHNMRATQVINDPFDPVEVAEVGLSGSVMDYADVNYAPPNKTQTAYYLDHPGSYDEWAITYGYSAAVADPAAEERRLSDILARSNEPGHLFGNDADDMRIPQNGIDPHVQISDLSSDAIGYAIGSFDHLRLLIGEMTLKQSAGEKNWDALVGTYTRLVRRHGVLAQIVASYIGGVHINRAPPASIEGEPYTPVALSEQKRAMTVLKNNVFAPDAMLGDAKLFSHLQTQRRIFDFYGKPEDPKLHGSWHEQQAAVLDRLIHANTLQRLTDSRLYGNQYSVASMLIDLSDAIFSADRTSSVNTLRQMLQVGYINRLVLLMKPESPVDSVARAAALYQLQHTLTWLSKKRRGNDETKAHTNHLVFLIESALDTKNS